MPLHRPIPRRLLLQAAAAGVTIGSMTLFARKAMAAQPLSVFTWSGYELPELRPGFDAVHGAPEFSFYSNQTEARTKLASGFVADAVFPTNETFALWTDPGYLKPIDESRLTHLADTLAPLTGLQTFFVDGKRFLAPTAFGSNGFIYREDLVNPEGEESWSMLFDPKYAGKIAIADGPSDIVPPTAALLGIQKYWEMTPEEMALIKAKLLEQKSLLRLHWSDATALEQSVASGEVVIAGCWIESYSRLKAQGIPVKWANPKEGTFSWVEGISLLASGTGSEDAAYDFINAWMSPESGKFLIEEYGYGSANANTYPLVDSSRLASLSLSDPLAAIEATNFVRLSTGAALDALNKMWAEVKATPI
jgi:spermidine/putrescine transport system substrate-binding protein